MSGASIAAMLEEWASSLREGKGRLGPLFRRERMAASAGLFVDGLLGPERRRTGGCAPQPRALYARGPQKEAIDDPGPWRRQAVFGRAVWEADALRDVVRDGGCPGGSRGGRDACRAGCRARY
jgi:hypothetical protein